MSTTKYQESLFSFVDAAVKLAKQSEADAVLTLTELPVNWSKLKKKTASTGLLVATNQADVANEAQEADINAVLLELPEATVQDQLTQAVLDSVAEDKLQSGSTIVAVFSHFDTDLIDTVSVLKLTERLGRLTARDLKKLKTKVPLETLKVVVDLAVEIGREGREGNPVGTMFVVGDHRKVTEESRPAGFDAVKGYTTSERTLQDPKVREAIKEIAQLDGMFVVSAAGVVISSARIVDTSAVELTMTPGLGTRHYAAGAISKNTKAIAVVVSQSSGTVRIFQNGEVVLRIEPLQRAMKWKEFEADSQPSEP